MTRIITNVPSLLAQRVLDLNNQTLTNSLERLSTGLRINTGKDDPAGLIASENLRAEKVAITAAIGNAERADQVINIAESGLAEVSSILTELESLVVQTANEAGQSLEEREANQLQIDNLLNAIDRIANQTTFQGTKLLNGTYSYITSGVNVSELTDVSVDRAVIPASNFIGVEVEVLQSAQTAEAGLLVGGGIVGSTLTFEVAGNLGVQNITVASGDTAADVATAVNNFTEVTGVSATVSGTDVTFDSTAFGSRQFVSVGKVAGDATYDTAFVSPSIAGGQDQVKDLGRDAVVTINGSRAQVDGLKARATSPSLEETVRLAQSQNTNGSTSEFSINGGGANFQFSPRVDLSGRVSVGIDAVTTGRLGSNESGRLRELGAGGSANVVTGDLLQAQEILDDAITDVTLLRGRLGSIQKDTIAPSIRSLGITFENVAAAESAIRDTDFAEETAELARAQLLVAATTQALNIANVRPQSVLQLLG
ncbi:MAG: flagellin [Phycisphaeraceae bacterium]|nr:flagellin [Phycisphaeraceae bacterium]